MMHHSLSNIEIIIAHSNFRQHAGKNSFRYDIQDRISTRPPDLLLKITYNCNSDPSIATETATAICLGLDLAIMTAIVFYPVGFTVRLGV